MKTLITSIVAGLSLTFAGLTTALSAEPSEAVTAAAKSLTPTQSKKLLDILNTGDEAALTALPGVGGARAEAIKKARPFKAPADLVQVEGIGDASFERIVAHAKAGFPAPEAKPDAAKGDGKSKSKAKAKAKTDSGKAKTDPGKAKTEAKKSDAKTKTK